MMDEREADAGQPYIGEELELFEHARRWKQYVTKQLQPYIAGDVLDVGCGFGANAPYLYRADLNRYLALEPDPRLCAGFRQRQASGRIPAACELLEGTIATLPDSSTFNSIVYLDVLEHIEDAQAEFDRAMQRLVPGGHLAILCPAHQWLFSPFDEAIGHFRRYDKRAFRELSAQPPAVLRYLDTAGIAASMANRCLMKQSYPTERQILFWDRALVPWSRWLDPLTGYLFGKSILGIWQK